MADDDLTSATEESGDEPQIRIPSREPLPQPPDIQYTRPQLGQSRFRRENGSTTASGSEPAEQPAAVRYSAGASGGLTLVCSILAGYWIGAEIDARWLHTQTPWATIVMVLAGTGLGFYNLFRVINRLENRKK